MVLGCCKITNQDYERCSASGLVLKKKSTHTLNQLRNPQTRLRKHFACLSKGQYLLHLCHCKLQFTQAICCMQRRPTLRRELWPASRSVGCVTALLAGATFTLLPSTSWRWCVRHAHPPPSGGAWYLVLAARYSYSCLGSACRRLPQTSCLRRRTWPWGSTATQVQIQHLLLGKGRGQHPPAATQSSLHCCSACRRWRTLADRHHHSPTANVRHMWPP